MNLENCRAGAACTPPRPLRRKTSCCLLARFNLRRHQTDLVDHLGAGGNVNYPGDILAFDVAITIHEHHAFRASLADTRQLFPQLAPSDTALIVFHRAWDAIWRMYQLSHNPA